MPANYWLLKSEPSAYSWSQLESDQKTEWTGIRNFEARNNLKAMKVGDLAFFYHSNEGKEIVGIAKIVGEAQPDSTSKKDEGWLSVHISPVKALKKPVGLTQIKAEKKLANFGLVKKSRLSVVPVTKEEWDFIQKL